MFRNYCNEEGRELDDDGKEIDGHDKVIDDQDKLRRSNRNSAMKGSEYKLLHRDDTKKEFRRHVHRLSLILSIDGASFKNKCKITVHPITFTIAELNNTKRYMRKNTMMVACAISRKKPSYQQLLNIGFWNQFKHFKNANLVLGNKNGEQFNFSVQVLSFVADQPATCDAALHKAHNSRNGCTQCKIETTVSPAVMRGTTQIQGPVRVYLYQNSYEPKENFRILFRKETDQEKCGVYGNSVLNKFLKLPNQIPRDIMHLVYEGVSRKMLILILRERTTLASEIDTYLTSIRIPHDTHRKPKGVKEINDWKASDHQKFLVYFWPVLKNNVHPNHLLLFAILSSIIRMLNNKRVKFSQRHYTEVKWLADRFLFWYQQIFGERNCSSNLHSIIHLPDQFEKFGQLSNCSAFVNEDFISTLQVRSLGSREYASQISNYYVRKLAIQNNVQDMTFDEDDPLKKFGSQFTSSGSGKEGKWFGNVCVLGKISIERLDKELILQADREKYLVDKASKVRVCSRIIYDGVEYHSQRYKKTMARVNTSQSGFVEYLDIHDNDQFAEIKYYVLPITDDSNLPVKCVAINNVCDHFSNILHGQRGQLNKKFNKDMTHEIHGQIDEFIDTFFWRVEAHGLVMFDVNRITNQAIKYQILDKTANVAPSSKGKGKGKGKGKDQEQGSRNISKKWIATILDAHFDNN